MATLVMLSSLIAWPATRTSTIVSGTPTVVAIAVATSPMPTSTTAASPSQPAGVSDEADLGATPWWTGALSALLGAVVGSLATAGAIERREMRQRKRETLAALKVVHHEIESAIGDMEGAEESRRRMRVASTFGYEQNQTTLFAAVKDTTLLRGLVVAYRALHRAKAGDEDPGPVRAELAKTDRLVVAEINRIESQARLRFLKRRTRSKT